MNPYLPVHRASQTLMKLVREKTAGHPAESIEQILPSITMIQQVFPEWTFKTCRLTHPNLDFISSNCRQLFGYNSDHMGQMGQHELYEHVPEEDCEDLYNSILFMQNFYSDKSAEDIHKIRAVMHYRFIRKDGSVILLRDEKASIQLNNATQLYYAVYKDISREMLFSGVRLAIFSNTTGEKLAEYKPVSKMWQLSDREGELLRFIRSGLTTKEMAWQMNISPHTVRNLRQRLFEKFSVSSSIDLLNKTAHL